MNKYAEDVEHIHQKKRDDRASKQSVTILFCDITKKHRQQSITVHYVEIWQQVNEVHRCGPKLVKKELIPFDCLLSILQKRERVKPFQKTLENPFPFLFSPLTGSRKRQ